jgi:uncharacterized protein (DUF1810 family)
MMAIPDPFDLQRFVAAQADIYQEALGEIRDGRKRTHWMWFIFPQLAGLGMSPTSQHYGITGLREAAAYLSHSLLGPRLIECSEAVTLVAGRSARDIFGSPDDMKLRSSATLFSRVTDANPVFRRILEQYFDRQLDPRTIALLGDVMPRDGKDERPS